MNGYIGITDFNWYRFLLSRGPLDEVNFWQPGGGRPLRTVGDFAPFLFKLKAPHNAICGFGFLYTWQRMPAWFAWDTFESRNGAPSRQAMYDRIAKYRKGVDVGDPVIGSLDIGCLLVNAPVFFDQSDWVPQPKNWPRTAVQGKTYDLTVGEGKRVWDACLERAQQQIPQLVLGSEQGNLFDQRARRIGQGTFRVAVTAAYENACAVTREHSLPVIDAAHIRPYASTADNDVRNGIALRTDLHRLFDGGYVTIDEDHRWVVSQRLKEEFDNGKTYYQMHGRSLWQPKTPELRPDPLALAWHREKVFVG